MAYVDLWSTNKYANEQRGKNITCKEKGYIASKGTNPAKRLILNKKKKSGQLANGVTRLMVWEN